MTDTTTTSPAPLLVDAAAAIMPAAYDACGAARFCGVSRSHWLAMVAAGRTPLGFRLGRRRLWLIEELSAWLRAGAPPREQWLTLRQTGGQGAKGRYS